MCPRRGGGKIGARPLPWKMKTNYFLLLFYLLTVFLLLYLLMWGCFAFFLFLMGAFFSLYGGLLATFFFLWGPFCNVGGSFLFFMEGIFATCPPPPPLQKLLGTSMPFLNFFTLQKIKFLGWGIHFYKPPSPLNMPLPTG